MAEGGMEENQIQNDGDDLDKCPICFELLTLPRRLPCSHKFCQNCLQSYIDKNQDRLCFACPVCRTSTGFPQTGLPRSQWAACYGKGDNVGTTIQTPLLDEALTYRCDPCKDNKEDVKAEVWCAVCSESLCEACAKSHSRLRLTKSHKVVQLKTDRLTEDETSFDSFCSQHKDQIILFYCKSHKTPCCSKCVVAKHRKCEDVAELEQLAKVLRTNPENVVDRIMSTKGTCLYLLSKKLNFREKMKMERQVMETKVSGLTNSWVQLIREKEEALLKEIRELQEPALTTVNEEIAVLEGIDQKLKELLKDTEKLEHMHSDYQLFQLSQNLQAECSNFDHRLENTLVEHRDASFNLTVNSCVEDAFGQLSKSNMGTVKALTSSKVVNKTMLSTTPTEIKTFNVRLSQETLCDCGSIGLLPDSMVVVSDTMNKKVKVFNSSGQISSEHEFSESPHSVAVLHNTTVAAECVVSVPDEFKVYFMKVNAGIIKISSEIKTPSKCYELSEFQNGCLALTPEGVIHIQPHINEVKQVFLEFGENFSKASGINGFYYDPEVKRVYWTKKDTLYCYTSHAEEIWTFKSNRSLDGLSTDCHGNIYVACPNAKNILQLAPNGKLGAKIPCKIKPRSVSFMKHGNNCAILGFDTERDDKVKILEFV